MIPQHLLFVMPGLDPGIHGFLLFGNAGGVLDRGVGRPENQREPVDGRIKSGHDVLACSQEMLSSVPAIGRGRR
jgi:hypothetical protein